MCDDDRIEELRIATGQMSETGTLMLKHADAASLHAMWSDLRGDRAAPFRAELDAAKIGAKAPFLTIFEHVGPSNFRIRIAGDRLNRWFGMELRGMSALSMIAADARNHVQAALNRVVTEPALSVVHGVARGADGEVTPFELVMLPMRSDFGRVDRVLAGLWLLRQPSRIIHPLALRAERIEVLAVDTALASAPVTSVSSVRPRAEARLGPTMPPMRRRAEPPKPVAPAPRSAEPAPAKPAAHPPVLRSIDGGETTRSPRRTGHLRLVKDG